METSELVQNPENGKDSSEDLEEPSCPSPVTVIKQEAEPGHNDDNGKRMEIDESSTEEDIIPVKVDVNVKQEEIDNPEIETNAQSRKRKLDEIDDDNEEDVESSENENSSPIDFLGFPDSHSDEVKRHEEKKEKFEKPSVKSDNIIFDTALGKGKRSRIPNKKYETPTIRSFSKKSTDNIDFEGGPEVTSSEDGRNDDEHEVHKMDDVLSEVSSSAHSSPSVGNRAKNSRLVTSAASPHNKKPKFTVDMTNPNFLKPFDLGWRRELVYRSSCDSYGRRNGDVYYYMPSGQKIRSMRELTETLDSPDLIPEDFTFFKEPVGLNDITKEVVRNAKVKGSWGNTSSIKKSTPKSKSSRDRNVPVTPDIGKSPRLGGFKVKFPGPSRLSQGSQKNDRKRSVDSEMEIGMLPPVWSPKKGSASKQSTWQAKSGSLTNASLDSKRCHPCSIRCQGVSGLIPTLQCRLCLCLYHKECVGEESDDVPSGYVCKNCQLDNQDKLETPFTPTICPPPLTPISSLKCNNLLSSIPPKLHKIPRPAEKQYLQCNTPRLSKQTLLPKKSELKTHKFAPSARYSNNIESSNKSAVRSMTTWLAPNSTIKMNANNNSVSDDLVSPKPQGLVIVGDRKFLVVPKGNVLSISPTVGAAANTPNSKRLVTPTADKAPSFESSSKEKTKLLDGTIPNAPVSASFGPISLPANVSSPAVIDKPTHPDSSEALPVDSKRDLAAKTAFGDTPKENQREPSPPKTRRSGMRKTTVTPVPVPKLDAETRFMQNYLQNLSYGYQTLMYVFQYLKVQDLLRAGCVCTLWRDIAGHPNLWRTVRMKNSQVSNWEGLADALKKHRTENLDLRKILLPNSGDDMWPLFSKAIVRVDSLIRIELCRCPASVIEELAKSNSNLQVINAVTIRCESLDMISMSNVANLQELRLKSTNGFVLTTDLSPLKHLTKLKHLSLTSVKELYKQNVDIIGNLINLESLDLGECSDFPDHFGTNVIGKLTKLEKLRLEKGQGTCCTFDILDAVSKISTLEQLELVNFDVKAGFDKALGACTNIKKLLIIPTYISQSATTNHMVLGGVIKLKATLSHFVWGVTLELLRVTELFVDQCEDSPNKDKKKAPGNGDSIPVLKPVPIMKTDDTNEVSSKEPPQVEILPLPTLQKLLLSALPTTRVKILKIPFHATWRQSIVDTVN